MDDNGVGPAETESGLADVTRLPLAELLSSGDTALDNSMRRVVADMDQGGQIISGFTSALPKEMTPPDSSDDR